MKDLFQCYSVIEASGLRIVYWIADFKRINYMLFSFLNRKTVPKDFTFLGTDIHSHLIPGIDDGCVDLEASLQCIRSLVEMGYSKIITTPHVMDEVYPNSTATIKAGLRILQDAVKEQQIPVTIEAAAEYKVDDNFIRLFKAGDLLTFGDNYLLIEFSFIAPPMNIDNIIFDLCASGYRPILAHPERYTYWTTQFQQFERLKTQGCLFQINLMSLVNKYGNPAKMTALKFIEAGMVNFFGTDLHRFEDIAKLKSLLDSKAEFSKLQQVKVLNSNL